MKILIAVTHLLGTGHLRRALTLGRAFVAGGHDVTLASGGMPVPLLDFTGINLVQLPPLRSDGTNFTRLLDANAREAGEDIFAARQSALISALSPAPTSGPDILITELFPFGRRVLSAEFMALLKAARTLARPPVILASVRDILAPPSKPSKAARADEIIAQFYDAVLVHSDPHSTRLEQSWPVSDALRARLKYTGYVAPPAAGPHAEQLGKGEILVSAGGGEVGTSLFETAIKAAHLMPSHRWRILVGGANSSGRITALQKANPPQGTIIEAARPEFRQMLYHANASVSMCGYNTALDLMQAGPPAVLVPFDDGQEVEQTLRAQSLGQMPGFAVLSNADMSPQALCHAVKQVMKGGRRRDTILNFDGAAQSVVIATDMARNR